MEMSEELWVAIFIIASLIVGGLILKKVQGK
jgi:hypothetical protein